MNKNEKIKHLTNFMISSVFQSINLLMKKEQKYFLPFFNEEELILIYVCSNSNKFLKQIHCTFNISNLTHCIVSY